MSELVFHKCRLCGCIFYHKSKDTYCAKCVPSFPHGGYSYEAQKRVYDILSNPERLERRRAWERERWRRRMADPKFREAERLRSLARARAERKYAKEIQYE